MELIKAGSNRKLLQLYQAWRKKKADGDVNDMYNFFVSCEEAKLIPKLVQLPLDKNEQDGLVNYLLNVSTFKNAKLQAIIYLLLKGKIEIALQHKDHCFTNDDLNGITVSALLQSYAKHFPPTTSIKQFTKESITPPRNERFNHDQTQTPLTDLSMLNESVRRRRSRKAKDQAPSHPMQTRASTKKKSFNQQ